MGNFVGNDVIDLADSVGRHPRFPERALGREAAARWRLAGADPRALWLAWSAKEAVVKLLRQEAGKPVPFLPSLLSWDAARSVVIWRGRDFSISHSEGDGWILATCVLGVGQLVSDVARWTEISDPKTHGGSPRAETPGALSESVRQLARRLLAAARPKWNFTALRFVVGPGGEPEAWSGESRLPVSLSFTHDGAFVGVSALFAVNTR